MSIPRARVGDMAGKDGSRRGRHPGPADESDYFFVVAEGSTKQADELFAAWLSDRGLERTEIAPGKLRVRGGRQTGQRQYLVHWDVLTNFPGD